MSFVVNLTLHEAVTWISDHGDILFKGGSRMSLIIFLILLWVAFTVFSTTNEKDFSHLKGSTLSNKDLNQKQVISGNVSDISKLMFTITMSIMNNASEEIGEEFKNKSPNIYGTAAFIIYITNNILTNKNFSHAFIDIANRTFLQEYLKEYIDENHLQDILNLPVKIRTAVQELGSKFDIKEASGTLRYSSLILNYIYALNILDLILKQNLISGEGNKLPSACTNLKAYAYITSIQLNFGNDLNQILDSDRFKKYYSNIYFIENKTNSKSNIKSKDNEKKYILDKSEDTLYFERTDGYYIRYEDYATDDISNHIQNNYSTSAIRNNLSNKVQIKSCSRCRTEYPETKEFFRHNPKGSFESICRICIDKKTNLHESKDSKAPKKTSKLKSLRECKQCGTQYPLTKEYFGYTPSGNFRGTCAKCLGAAVKRHSEQNPHLVKARAEKRRKLVQNSADIKDYDDQSLKLFLYQQSKTTCFYCRKTMEIGKATLDHMNPLSRGGLDLKENIVLACGFCNREKHHKTVEEYRIWLRERKREVLF